MNNETFEKEITMCRKLSRENGGKCSWGECEKCGVIPLLFKLGRGEFYEKEEEIREIKKNALE